MVPSNATLRRRLYEGYRAAYCIVRAYDGIDGVAQDFGVKIAQACDYFITVYESPGERASFFEWAHRARTKTFVNRQHMEFMMFWWDLMFARSELWRIVKRDPIPCEE